MAEEFTQKNDPSTIAAFRQPAGRRTISFEPHLQLKERVPGAIGLIRTGDDTIYANVVLESA